jgi:regulatory protein YycI of two-component signal transduction system YycFG
MRVKYIFSFILIIIVLVLLNGCATVQPWEKEPLADPIMIINNNPIESGLKEHHIDYREGSSGATGAQSGGCGCG